MRTQADRDFDLEIGREVERKDAEIDRLRGKLLKVVAWLDRQASYNEQQASICRFESLRQSYAADAKNYRAAIADIKTVLPSL
jgi:hypothetical protein